MGILKSSNTNFQLLFESTPGLYLVLLPDKNFTIIAVNDAYANTTMTKRDDIIDKGLFEVFPDNPDDQMADGVSNLRASLNSVLKNKSAHTMATQKYDIRKPDGEFEIRYWSPFNKPVLNSKNEILYIIHQVEDVTASILMEQKGIDQARTARIEIEEKTLFIKNNEDRINKISEILLKYTLMDFSEELPISKKGDELDAISVGLNTMKEELVSYIHQLKESEDHLLAANKELESFSYSVSHDLRAPLRAVNGYAQMLNEDHGSKLDEEGKRIIQTIRFNAARMGTLIDDLLSFSRLGRKEVHKTLINMNDLLEVMLMETSKSLTNKAKVNVGKLHKVKADYGLMQHVMFNLLSNAIKYSSKTENPIIEISSEEKGTEIIFSVKDNGAGFDMRYYNKLFGVFQRLHTQDEFEGTGVGLAIIQRIIAKHGGKVWAEGKVGEGAIFNFSLTKN